MRLKELTVLVKKLEKSGLVEIKKCEKDNRRKFVSLTEKGEEIGKQLTRRHRLTERLLADVLDFNRTLIEQVACNMEHNLSTDLADSICTLLGHPKQCPHGNPIPEGDCCKKAVDTLESIVMPLSKIDVDEEVKLSYMVLKDKDFMNKLISLGLIPSPL